MGQCRGAEALDAAFERWSADRLGDAARAWLWGVWSAATELGLAACAFHWVLGAGSLWLVIVFGAGAGAIEIVYLLSVALWPRPVAHLAASEPEPAVGSTERHADWTFVVERTGASIGHVGSRGLTWLSLLGHPWFAVLALAAFAAVDGVATFGHARRWDWLEWRVWSRYYAFVAITGLLEVLVFVAVALALT